MRPRCCQLARTRRFVSWVGLASRCPAWPCVVCKYDGCSIVLGLATSENLENYCLTVVTGCCGVPGTIESSSSVPGIFDESCRPGGLLIAVTL